MKLETFLKKKTKTNKNSFEVIKKYYEPYLTQ